MMVLVYGLTISNTTSHHDLTPKLNCHEPATYST